MQIYRKASLRAGSASHPSRTFGRSLEVIISPSRLDDDSCHFYDISSKKFQKYIARVSFTAPSSRTPPRQAMAVSRGSCPGESFGAQICAIPCSLRHLMPSRVHPHPMVLQQISQHSQHQSTARIRVPSGPFGLAEEGLLFEHFFFSQF